MSQAIVIEGLNDATQQAPVTIVEEPTSAMPSKEVGNSLTELIHAGLHSEDRALRLRIAHGQPALKGFINLDGADTPHPSATVHCAYDELVFPDASVDALRIDQVLETLPLVEALGHLIRWQRWLKPGGTLVVACTDIESCARMLLTRKDPNREQAAISQLFGEGMCVNQDGWYRGKLRRVLVGFGFNIESIQSASNARHLVEVSAVKGDDNPPAAMLRAAKSILADGLGADRAEIAYHDLVYYAEGSPAAPAKHTEALLSDLPTRLEELTNAAAQAIEDGAFERAHQVLIELVTLIPDNPDLLLTLANVKLKLGQLVDAERILSQALSLNDSSNIAPDLAHCFCTLGAHQHQAGAIEAARTSYQQALAIQPALETARISLQQLEQKRVPAPTPTPTPQIGEPQRGPTFPSTENSMQSSPDIRPQETPQSPNESWSPTASEAPASPPFGTKRRQEIMGMFDKAEALAQAGRWPEAAEAFLQLVEDAPHFGPAYVALASAAFAINELETGLIALEHAISIYPNNADLYLQHGVVSAHTEDYAKAQQSFLRVLDIDEKNVDALISLAQLCRVGKNYEEAVQLVDQANQLEPTNPTVIGAIGTIALELGDRQGAVTAQQQLQQIAPDHPETQVLLQLLTEHEQDAAQ